MVGFGGTNEDNMVGFGGTNEDNMVGFGGTNEDNMMGFGGTNEDNMMAQMSIVKCHISAPIYITDVCATYCLECFSQSIKYFSHNQTGLNLKHWATRNLQEQMV